MERHGQALAGPQRAPHRRVLRLGFVLVRDVEDIVVFIVAIKKLISPSDLVLHQAARVSSPPWGRKPIHWSEYAKTKREEKERTALVCKGRSIPVLPAPATWRTTVLVRQDVDVATVAVQIF